MKAVLAEGITKPAEVDFVTAYSGGKLMLPDWEKPVVFDLQSTTVHDNLPILLYHNSTRRVGTVTQAIVECDKISMSGIIVRTLSDSQIVLDVHENGGVWECSIGTGPIPDEDIQFVEHGEITVNGQLLTAPFYLISNAMIREVSFVSAGADPRTTVTIRASLLKEINMETDEKFIQFVKELGLNWETLDEENRANLKAAYELKGESEAKDETVEEPVEAECETAPDEEKVEAEAVASEPEEEKQEVKASALKSAKERIAIMKSVNRPSGQVTRPSEKRIVEASLLLSSGAKDTAIEKAGYSQSELNEASSREYRNVGLHGIMRRAIKASGLYLSQDCSDRDLVRAYHESVQAAGLSTRDFSPSGILSNIADKMLRIQADQLATVANEVFYTRSVKNFNKVSSGKLDILGTLPDVQPGEDFTTIGLSDASQDYKITKRGVNLAITLEDQINDDLGAFERALQQFGRIFANSIDQTAIGSLMSQVNTLFTTSNKKKATLAFSAENLKTVTGMFARIKDKNGDYRNLIPGSILTGPETAITARAIFEFNDRASIAPQTSTEVLVAPYNVLGTPFIAANQGWFLLPRDEKIGEVAYLNGNKSPTIEQANLNVRNLNIEFVVWGTCGTLIYADAPAIYSVPAN